ncbi:MAG: YjbQ family protein [Pseudomonadales bacterium]|nr:YjbQ family protein [Pseudomonadales bacterium]NIX08526.1 YjbQ family protein [Pseudomonadales bacterium]
MNYMLSVSTGRQGLYDITHKVVECLGRSGISEGLVTVFVRHTSASLLIQENADPSAREDLESWLNRLVPELDEIYTHRAEGPDDMPAHIKSALTATSLSIPVLDSAMVLGTWQGIFVWEHRHHHAQREIIVNVLNDS